MSRIRVFVLFLCLAAPATSQAARLFSGTTAILGVPGFPRGITLVDINRDGVDDAFVPLAGGRGLGIALATGGGSFAPFSTRFIDRGDLAMEAVDVDGDGLIDAAGITHWGLEPEPTRLFVAFGDGNGGWVDSFEVVLPGLVNPMTGDLDGDGRADVVLGIGDSLTIFHANANRTLSRTGTYDAADFTSNGLFVDLVGSSAIDFVVGTTTGIAILEGNGDGTLGARTDVPLGGSWNSITLATIDANPGLDLVLASPGVAFSSGSGGGSFALPVPLPNPGVTSILGDARDVDGDGKTDIIATTSGTGLRGIARWLGDGAGAFGPRKISGQAIFVPGALDAGDADGDLRTDYAWLGSFTSTALLAFGRADGSFGEPQSASQVSGQIVGLAAGDFDEDGHLDAFGGDTFNFRLAFAHGHGDGTFDPLVLTAAMPFGYSHFASGHFDSDAHLDVFALRYDGTSSRTTGSFFKGHGNGTFDAPVDFALPGSGFRTLATDFDGDGKLDVAVTCPNANAIALLKQGPAGLLPPVTSPSIAAVSYVAFGDLNADGRADRVVSGQGQWAVELENGAGGYVTQPVHVQTPTTGALALADFDGDGLRDVAVGQNSTGTTVNERARVHVWRGQPGGVFDSESTISLNWSPDPTVNGIPSVADLIAQDFDGDGDADLVARAAGSEALLTAARGRGDRTFERPEAYSATYGSSALVPGDFDEDGFVDFVNSGGAGSTPVTGIGFVRNLSGGVVGVPRAPSSRKIALAITRLAPNPSRGAFALDLSASAAGEARVTLVSLAGRIVLDRTVALREGANRVPLEAKALRPGVYWARAEAFGQAVSRKVVVLQ